MTFLNWFQDNWFTLLQSLGIIGGLVFSATSQRLEAKERRNANQLEITKQHREIWTEIYSRPDLKRVVNPTADITAKPITEEEELFVNFLILHLASSYRAAKAGMFLMRAEIKTDISEFFSLPIPRAVWERRKIYQDRSFIRFVEGYLNKIS